MRKKITPPSLLSLKHWHKLEYNIQMKETKFSIRELIKMFAKVINTPTLEREKFF